MNQRLFARLTVLILLLFTTTTLITAQDTDRPPIDPDNATELALIASFDLREYGSANMVTFTPDGDYVLIGSDSGRISRYDSAGSEAGEIVTQGIGEILSIDFNNAGEMLVSGTLGNAIIYNLSTASEVMTLSAESAPSLQYAVYNPRNGSQVVGVSQNNFYLFTVDTSEIASYEQVAEERVYAGGFNDLAFSPDGSSVLLATNSAELLQISIDDGETLERQVVFTLDGADAISTVAMDDDFQTIILAGDNGETVALNPDTYEELYRADIVTNAIDYSIGNLVVALANNLGRFTLLDTITGEVLAQYDRDISDFDSMTNDVTFSPDGRTLAIAAATGIVELYGVGDGENTVLQVTPEPTTEDIRALLDDAQNAYADASYQDAVELATLVLDVEVDNIEALRIRADSYRRLDDNALATADYTTLLSLDSTDADHHFFRGLTAYRAEDTDYAMVVDDMTMAIELNFSDLAWAHNVRALSHVRLENYDEALADYDRALEILPTYRIVYSNRAILLGERLGQWMESMDDRKYVLLELAPNSGTSFNNLAWGYVQIGQYQEALGFANLALEIEPDESNTVDTRGWAYLGLGEYDLAITDFEQAIALDNMYSHFGLGVLYAELGDTALAIENLEIYLEDAGESADEDAIALFEALQADAD